MDQYLIYRKISDKDSELEELHSEHRQTERELEDAWNTAYDTYRHRHFLLEDAWEIASYFAREMEIEDSDILKGYTDLINQHVDEIEEDYQRVKADLEIFGETENTAYRKQVNQMEEELSELWREYGKSFE